MDISFVIPCYNEKDNVRVVYETIRKIFSEKQISFEAVMVNDGSKDGTEKELKKLYADYPDGTLKVVSFSRNFGKEAAILCGLKHTTGDAVCFIDADMQQRPEVALAMYEKLISTEDIDCVAAYQKSRKENFLLSFFKKCFYFFINLITTTRFTPGASDFRVISRRMANAILSMQEYFRFSKGLFSWVGFETYFMEYTVEERLSGSSKWSFWKLFKYALEGIIGYSTVPLSISNVLGILLMLGGLGLLIAGLIISDTVMTILGVVLLVGGLILLMIGITGMYISRIYLQGKNRPIYIEKDVLEGETDGCSR